MTLTIIMVTLQNDIAIVLLYPPLKRSFLLPIKLLLCVPVQGCMACSVKSIRILYGSSYMC